MNFIKEYLNTFTPEFCSEIVNYYLENNTTKSLRNTSNLSSSVREFDITNSDDGYWEKTEKEVAKLIEVKVKEYLDFSKESNFGAYYYRHATLMHQSIYRNIPPHYDCEFEYSKDSGEEFIRNFAVLVYLNGDLDGGELLFPVQKTTITPVAGKVVIFPTSFMYPHLTMPTLDKDRFVYRVSYLFNKQAIIDVVKNSRSYS